MIDTASEPGSYADAIRHSPCLNAANRKLRVLDLFSGIGGFSLGLERAKLEGAEYDGFETVAFCEIEPFPRKVLAKHWPSVPCYTDVRELTAERLAADGIAVDVICGGFPCQGISVAAPNAKGLADERSGLFAEVARLVGELAPVAVILENSAMLLGRGLADVLGALAALGYDAEWHCIPAGAIGAPHERDRIWIVAYPNSERRGEHNCSALPILSSLAGDTHGFGFEGWETPWECQLEAVCRVDDGLRGRLDKLGFQALGNAIVPQIATLLGHAILASLHEHRAPARRDGRADPLPALPSHPVSAPFHEADNAR